MRCIETLYKSNIMTAFHDKLQHEMYWNIYLKPYIKPDNKINYNMRCIETWFSCGSIN